MKFARIVFWASGVFGVLLLTPLYFARGLVERVVPPPITHPQFYYGFIGVALVWQFVYITVATDPVRYRPLMVLSALAKGSYVAALLALALAGSITTMEASSGAPDAIMIVLFVAAYFKTPRSAPATGPRS